MALSRGRGEPTQRGESVKALCMTKRPALRDGPRGFL